MALKNAHAGKAYPAGRAGRLDTDLAPPPGLSPSRGCQRQGGPRAGWGAFEQRGAWKRGCVAAGESTSPSSTDLVAVIGLPVTGSPWRTPVRLPPRVRRTTGTAPDLRCREPAPQLIGHAIPGSGQIYSQRPSGRYWPAASPQLRSVNSTIFICSKPSLSCAISLSVIHAHAAPSCMIGTVSAETGHRNM